MSVSGSRKSELWCTAASTMAVSQDVSKETLRSHLFVYLAQLFVLFLWDWGLNSCSAFSFVFETVSCSAVLGGLKLTILLPQPPTG
jgi:hypothetical protein